MAANPHLQTLWSPFFRAADPGTAARTPVLPMATSSTSTGGPHDAETPLVLALHGLTGSSSSHYILGLQRALLERGWASVG